MSKKNKRAKDITFNDIAKQAGDRERKQSGKIFTGGGLTSQEREGLKQRVGFKPVGATTLPNTANLIKIEEGIQEYNKSITDLQPLYSELKPVWKIIVRAYHLEAERTPGGIILPPEVKVKVPTQNGLGTLEELESPWQLSRKAVVVAVNNRLRGSENPWLKQGDIISLGNAPMKILKAGKNMNFELPSGFTHPQYNIEMPPTDISDQHFGYLLVDEREIEIVV